MPKNGWGAGCQFTRGHSPCASAVEGRNTEDDRRGDVPGCAGRPLDVPQGISREVRGGVRPCGHLQNSLRRGDAKRADQDDTAANLKRTTSRNPYDCNESSLRADGGGAVRGGGVAAAAGDEDGNAAGGAEKRPASSNRRAAGMMKSAENRSKITPAINGGEGTTSGDDTSPRKQENYKEPKEVAYLCKRLQSLVQCMFVITGFKKVLKCPKKGFELSFKIIFLTE